MFIGATNYENNEMNKIRNLQTNEWGSVPEVARAYKKSGIKWVAVGDENYGKLITGSVLVFRCGEGIICVKSN